ncbi:MAG: hypothetical protein ACK5OA_03730 [Acidovorax sp.]|jgi:hypothetical protein
MSFTSSAFAHAAAHLGLGMVPSAFSQAQQAVGARMITTITTAAT